MGLLSKETGAGWMPYIWLGWLLFFVAAPAYQAFSPMRWALTFAATVVFLALYFIGLHFKTTKVKLWVTGAIGLLGVVLTPMLGDSGCVFFVYAAAFAGFLEGTSLAISILLSLEVIACAAMWESHLPLTLRIAISLLIAAVGAMNIQHAKREAANRRLLQAQGEIAGLAKTAERERISRDLHDVLGHTLSVIILKSELASRIANRDLVRAVREMRDIEQISRQALSEVRSALKGYRASGLRDEIAQARATLETAGIKVEVSTGPDEWHLGPAQEGVLALVVREAVTNILRHAHASECHLSLSECDGVCRLQVSDNGVGGDGAEGQGLRGMRERLESLGGSLLRSVSPGTTLTATIPRTAPKAVGTS